MCKRIILCIFFLFIAQPVVANDIQTCFDEDNSEALQQLVHDGFDVTQPQFINGERGTIYYHACKWQKKEILDTLKASNILVDQKTFVSAAKQDNVELLKLGLRQGIDINIKVFGETALDAATLHGKVRSTEFLISNDARINPDQSFTYAACNQWDGFLTIAIERGIRKDSSWYQGAAQFAVSLANSTISYLWQYDETNHSLSIEAYDRYRPTSYKSDALKAKSFQDCCRIDNAEFVQQCLQEKIFTLDESIECYRESGTPLYHALYHKRFNMVRGLIKAGANVDQSSLLLALENNFFVVIQQAVRQGFDFNQIHVDEVSQFYALHPGTVRLLIDAGVPIDTAMIEMAVQQGCISLLERALDYNVIFDADLYRKIEGKIGIRALWTKEVRKSVVNFFHAQGLPEEVLH